MENLDTENKIRNVIRDTRREIKYIIFADTKLSREKMLAQVKIFNMKPGNIKLKKGTEVTIIAE